MVSAALQHKIDQQRAAAPLELPKARLCARVVLAALAEDPSASGGADLVAALAALKADLGQRWSAVTAIQYMSGRQAEFAAECGLPQERAGLLWAHLVAKALADGAQPLGGLSSAHVKALQGQAQMLAQGLSSEEKAQ